MDQHKWHTPECIEDCSGCMWCAGGLQTCKTCGTFEGAAPDECPGRQMSPKTVDAVYMGKINYRDGAWQAECCQAMRHIYDRNGNPKWIKVGE